MVIMASTNQKILLGVSGGIAAYKAAELIRRLRDGGAEVRVVMTRGASSFVTSLTLQAVSGNPVHQDLLDESAEAAMGHIELARWADLVLIAPATAHVLARIAHGLADDLLTTACLATSSPIALAPSMNQQMWSAPATQANVKILADRGLQIWGPGDGSQACGEVGPGRMLEPLDLAQRALRSQADGPRNGPLWGQRVVVTAGPTREAIDPVRYISNHSSGKMGFAVARAAHALGAQVQLIAGPTSLETPLGVERTDVVSAADMHRAAMALAPGADVFVAAAAVADYAPADVADKKLKKNDTEMVVGLMRNPDILADVAGFTTGRPFCVGFAAETNDLKANAQGKLSRKRLDLIAGNLVGDGQGFDVDTNALTVYWSDGEEHIPSASKDDVAQALWTVISNRRTPLEKD
jgi:phosphopantothenoylcysteine decarboxylase / phosphopantothenate---cysteine ligase